MNYKQILKDHDLRVTQTRLDILTFISEKEATVSQSELESHLEAEIDRVTIYRTLNTFEKSGLIHKVVTEESGTQFALCHHDCHEEEHNDDHVHFSCVNCGTTVCLHDIMVPQVKLPDTFVLQNANLMLSGICNNCNFK